MLRRLLLGLIKGIAVGVLIAVALSQGFGVTAVGAFLAYALAVVTGILTGLVAGKPIWAKGARVEAGLKAGVGALVAAGAMYAIRKWLGVDLDLGSMGQGTLGELPIISLPMIATILAVFYEIDNNSEEAQEPAVNDKGQEKKRIAASSADQALVDELLEDEEEAAPSRARRRG